MTISSILYGMLGQTKRAGLATLVVWGGLTLPLPGWAQTASPSAAAKALTAPQVKGENHRRNPLQTVLTQLQGQGRDGDVLFHRLRRVPGQDAGAADYEGWNSKPFELVVISTDARVQDLMDYECFITRTAIFGVGQRSLDWWRAVRRRAVE